MQNTLEHLRTLAQSGDYRRIPIKRDLLADFITPIEALRMLRAASTHCFLLESAEAEERWGRYTFLGLKPSLEFCCSGGVARIRKNIETDRETCEIFKVKHPSTLIRRIIAENKSPVLKGFHPLQEAL